ncbi:hypothetical protein C3B59_10440 [Cryobacterium zongtaii]|uniref:Head-to-tail adaptor n=1 Tax=Cryobacterium zongtaii TaxID=1259217 RepID=A0A2S3ZCF8_9MICO|nr:hypothetical protein [Cryobacterium zongtaii]POH63953.1 hypothetical protein C3B59_10440 [Cryobacterium zongtaii]
MAALASAADLATYSKGAISASDPRAGDALEGATTAIRNYCGWHVTPVETSELVLDGPGGRLLSLPTKNLHGIASLVEDDAALVDNVDFRWSADGSVKRKHALWSDEFRIIEATISHGYAEAADLKRVVLSVVARELSSPTGATREQAGAVSISWALSAPGVSGGIALLQNERSILDFYRIEDA